MDQTAGMRRHDVVIWQLVRLRYCQITSTWRHPLFGPWRLHFL